MCETPKVNTLSPGSLAVDGRWQTPGKDSAVSRATVKQAGQIRPRRFGARPLVAAALLLPSLTAVDLPVAGSQALAAAVPQRQGQNRIVDALPGSWGHIYADDLRFRTVDTARPAILVAGLAFQQPSLGQGPPTLPPRPVPDLLGRTEREARQLLERAGLGVGTVTTRSSPATPGTVITQTPQADSTVRAGSAVSFVLAEPATLSVPDLVGRSLAQARAIVAKLPLSEGSVSRRESRQPEGTVLVQQPGARTEVVVGTAIDLTVAIPRTVALPDLVGRSESEARQLLARAELSVRTVEEAESRRRPGTVLSQAPVRGTQLEVGAGVDFTVATLITVPVPDLVGRTEAEARVLLFAAELLAGSTTSRESRLPPGTVLVQSIQAGTRVEIGRDVDVTVARPVTVLVPDLVGRNESAARSLLDAAELLAGDTTSSESREPPGTVLVQSITAGTPVEIGRGVDVIIARPVTVLVPDLVGRNESAARSLLEATELVAGNIQHQESAAQPGTVLAQSLNPGSLVEIGTAVPMLVAVVETVEIPDVVGLSVEAARRDLVIARLGVGSEGLLETRIEEENTVLQQGRQAGTVAAVGTPINLVIATPEMITVPNVVSLSDAQAAGAITDTGLVVGVLTERFSLQAGGTVLAQGQAANTQVAFDTPIALQVARPRTVWMVPGTLLLLAMATLVRLRKARRAETALPDERPTPPRETRDLAELPQLRIRPDADDGTQRMETPAKPLTRLELQFRAVADAGTQEVHADGDLIASERRAHE